VSGAVLLVSIPTRIHPRLERLVAGAPIDELDVHHLPRHVQGVIWKSHMRYLRANPRGAAYMMRAAADALAATVPGAAVDLLSDPAFAAAVAHGSLPLREVFAVEEARVADELRRRVASNTYDRVILLYRDATGLRWSAVDRAALAAAPGRVFVLNGRRRLFPLTPAVWRTLRRRRALEISWLPELVFTTALLIGGTGLALYDAVARPGRSR
jgi:hypothetical protein